MRTTFRLGAALLAGATMFFCFSDAHALGQPSHVSDYLTRQGAGLVSGEVHQIFFAPSTNLSGSGNTVELRFPNSQIGQWCRGSGPLSVSPLSNPDGASEGATFLPGSLQAICTPGAGPNGDVIIVYQVGSLIAGVKYGVRVSDGAAKLGTPPAAAGIPVTLALTDGATDIDQGALYLTTNSNDQVMVTANVVTFVPPVDTNPAVTFVGFAASDGEVVVSRDGSNVGHVTTGPDSLFNVTVSDQPVGAHTFVLSGTDAQGASLAPITFVLLLTLNTTTYLNNVFLGPSIAIDQTTLKLGQSFQLSGATAPNSSVTVTLQSNPTTVTATSDGQGEWQMSVNSTTIGTGSHTAKARAMTTSAIISAYSQTINFSVNPVGSCDGKATADLNCDGKVNLTDFSVLLFFWQQKNPSNARADINNDGVVDIVDFSILLYQWTG